MCVIFFLSFLFLGKILSNKDKMWREEIPQFGVSTRLPCFFCCSLRQQPKQLSDFFKNSLSPSLQVFLETEEFQISRIFAFFLFLSVCLSLDLSLCLSCACSIDCWLMDIDIDIEMLSMIMVNNQTNNKQQTIRINLHTQSQNESDFTVVSEHGFGRLKYEGAPPHTFWVCLVFFCFFSLSLHALFFLLKSVVCFRFFLLLYLSLGVDIASTGILAGFLISSTH